MVLWDRFDGMYGQRFRSRFTGDESAVGNWAREWSLSLYEHGVTFAMAKKVIDTLRHRLSADSWPPELAEFISMACEIPDYEEAFREAQMQAGQMEYGADVWSHPAIYWAVIDWGGIMDFRNASWKSSRQRWMRLLGARLGQRDLTIPKRLPKPEYQRGSKEKGVEALRNIRSMLGMREAA